jgi:hypothetical protein
MPVTVAVTVMMTLARSRRACRAGHGENSYERQKRSVKLESPGSHSLLLITFSGHNRWIIVSR